MGNFHKKPIVDAKSIISLKKEIEETCVNHDFNMMIFIDGSISNNYTDNTSLHNIPKYSLDINKKIINNQYIFILDILRDFFDEKYQSEITLFLFGTVKANKNEDKLEKVLHRMSKDKYYKCRTNLCKDIDEVINGYVGEMRQIKKHNHFSKNDTFVNIIDKCIENIKITKKYTIALIITDDNLSFDNQDKSQGSINKSNEEKIHCKDNIYENVKKITSASHYPLSIICVCIGNNNFNILKYIDDLNYKKMKLNKKQITELKSLSKFDNFQTVILKDIVNRDLVTNELRDEVFKEIFSEIPKQYEIIQKKDVLSYKKKAIRIEISSSYRRSYEINKSKEKTNFSDLINILNSTSESQNENFDEIKKTRHKSLNIKRLNDIKNLNIDIPMIKISNDLPDLSNTKKSSNKYSSNLPTIKKSSNGDLLFIDNKTKINKNNDNIITENTINIMENNIIKIKNNNDIIEIKNNTNVIENTNLTDTIIVIENINDTKTNIVTENITEPNTVIENINGNTKTNNSATENINEPSNDSTI